MLVDGLPVLVPKHGWLSGGDEVVESGMWPYRRAQSAVNVVVEKCVYGVSGVLLIGSDEPGCASLDPSGGVDTGYRLVARAVEDPAVSGRDAVVRFVEGQAGDGLATVAHRSQNEAAVEDFLARGVL